jgi:quercetin dioxygenase-like cupin family protein
MEVSRNRKDTQPGPKETFTGEVWLDAIAAQGSLRVLSVHFTPGARTAWHSHPSGQILHVTEGAGRVQSRGGDVEQIRAGDTVVAGPGEWHWHGAAPGTFMTHFAISGGETEWSDHVTDEEYRG